MLFYTEYVALNLLLHMLGLNGAGTRSQQCLGGSVRCQKHVGFKSGMIYQYIPSS